MSKPTKDLRQGQDDLPKKESRWCSERHVHANVSFEQAAISCQRGSAPKTGFILQEKQAHIKLAFGFRIAFQHHREKNNSGTQREKGGRVRRWGRLTCSAALPERSCLMRPLLVAVSTGRKSLNQEISGSGLPLAAQSMVAVRAFSTTFSCGPMSMVGKPAGRWSSARGENTQG